MAPTKRIKKNGFILYAEDRMPDLKEVGHTFPGGVKDAIPLVSTDWAALPQEKKTEYNNRAKELRNVVVPDISSLMLTQTPMRKGLVYDKHGVPRFDGIFSDPHDLKKTTFGFTVGDIKLMKMKKMASKMERKAQCKAIADVENPDGIDPRDRQIILIKFSAYCWTDDEDYIPAEIGMATFTLRDGIIDNYSALIDPGECPRGSRYECMKTAQQNGLPLPPYSDYCRDYGRILTEILNYIDSHRPCLGGKRLLFCTRTDTTVAESCFNWLHKASGIPQPEEKYALRPIGLLFLCMFQSGSEFHDKIKEEERKLSPEELATTISRDLVYKCGVPYFIIEDGRIRSRQLEFYDRAQVYDGVGEDDRRTWDDAISYDHVLEIIDGSMFDIMKHNEKKLKLKKKDEDKKKLSQSNSAEVEVEEASCQIVTIRGQNTKIFTFRQVEFQPIPEDEESEIEAEDLYNSTTSTLGSVHFGQPIEPNQPRTPPETVGETKKSIFVSSKRFKPTTGSQQSHVIPHFLEDTTIALEDEMQEDYNITLSNPEEDMYFAMRSRRQAELMDQTQPNLIPECLEIIQKINEMNKDKPAEDKAVPYPGPLTDFYDNFKFWSKSEQELENAYAETADSADHDPPANSTKDVQKRVGHKPKDEKDMMDLLYMKEIHKPRAAVWSQPYSKRRPGDAEKYGDIDPMLALLWEGDAMNYLRSLDCAYIAEICCPHHTVNNDKWEECPLNLMNRIALNFLDAIVGFWNIRPIEGKHYPYRDVALEGEKRMYWSKKVFGHQQYGYMAIPGFADSGQFEQKKDDEKADEKEPEKLDEDDHNDLNELTDLICDDSMTYVHGDSYDTSHETETDGQIETSTTDVVLTDEEDVEEYTYFE